MIRSAGSIFQPPRDQDDEDVDVVGLEDGRTVFDMKASDYVDMVLKGHNVSGRDSLMEEKEETREQRNREKRVRSKVGRPKGSRSIGLTVVKKVNPNLEISDQLMGEECGIDNCAVRLKVQKIIKAMFNYAFQH